MPPSRRNAAKAEKGNTAAMDHPSSFVAPSLEKENVEPTSVRVAGKSGKKIVEDIKKPAPKVEKKNANKERPNAKASGKGIVASEEEMAPEATTSAESIIAELTSKLEQVTLEKKSADAVLQEKAACIAQKDSENEALAAQVKALAEEKDAMEKALLAKLHKKENRAFQPDLTIPAGAATLKKPVKSASAFLLWCVDARRRIATDKPGLAYKEVPEELGRLWKELTPQEKAPYEEQAAILRDRWLQEKLVYDKVLADEKAKEAEVAMELLKQWQAHQNASLNSKGKKEKDPDKPKHPKSAFLLFSMEEASRISKSAGKFNVAEVSKVVGAKWAEMKEEDKATYDKAAAVEKERYLKEMEVYNAKKAEEEAIMKAKTAEEFDAHLAEAMKISQELERKKASMIKMRQLAKEQLEAQKAQRALMRDVGKKERDPNKPKRPPTGFILFSTEARKKILLANPTISFGEISTTTAAMWKALPEQEKVQWNLQTAPQWNEYNAKMAEYRKQHADDVSSFAPSDMSYQMY